MGKLNFPYKSPPQAENLRISGAFLREKRVQNALKNVFLVQKRLQNAQKCSPAAGKIIIVIEIRLVMSLKYIFRACGGPS